MDGANVLVLLDKLLARLRNDSHRVLIFGQMARMLDILSDYLSFRNYLHQQLDGMVSSDARKKSIAPSTPQILRTLPSCFPRVLVVLVLTSRQLTL